MAFYSWSIIMHQVRLDGVEFMLGTSGKQPGRLRVSKPLKGIDTTIFD